MHSQGDIWLVPVPFTDLTSSKKRPVVVLSNNGYNMITEDIVVAAMTSNVEEKPYSVTVSSDDLSEGELLRTSCIRADKIYTLSKSIAIKKFGTVKPEIIETVRQNILELLN
ncbi:MAG: type II toxin-antitoxin system PemK/MazF family toxin [Oscillospiraceae bacterium]|jgi:mRNA interferase MazF|nr:type II toxin-antitoxin system PemK/MazF family toxin [Oscillospiraceae bacterium]